jgi:hypothetical protein
MIKLSSFTPAERARYDEFLATPTNTVELENGMTVQFFPEPVETIIYEEREVEKNGKVVKQKVPVDRHITKLWERPVITFMPEDVTAQLNFLYQEAMKTGYNASDVISNHIATVLKGKHTERLTMDTHDSLDSLIDGIVRVGLEDAFGAKVSALVALSDVLKYISASTEWSKALKDRYIDEVIRLDSVALKGWLSKHRIDE